MTENQRKMIVDWMRKIHQLEYAHCFQSVALARIDKIIGFSAFGLTTVVAFIYRFPDIDPCFANNYHLALLKKEYSVPFLSLLAALATGLLTFVKASEKATLHHKIGMSYEKLRHEIEVILNGNISQEEVNLEIERIEKIWAELNTAYVSEKYFQMGKKRAKSLGKYPRELSFLPDTDE